MLKSVTQDATKAHTEAWDLDSNLWPVGVWGPCHSRGHIDLGGPCCHTRHGVIQAQAAAMGHVWVHDPILVRVWIDGSDSCCQCEP